MKIITISGYAGSGKDTVASIIKGQLEADGHSVLVMHYADLLKYICKTFFGWDGIKDERGRTILQYVGTDIIRKQNPDYWVNFISNLLIMFPEEWEYVLIPDCRFPNEISVLKNDGHNVLTIHVIRDGLKSTLTKEQQQHVSETALDDYDFDYYIHNGGSIIDLKQMISEWLIDETGIHQITIDEILGEGGAE